VCDAWQDYRQSRESRCRQMVGNPYLTGLCHGCRFYRDLSFAPNQGLGEEAEMSPSIAMTLCFGTFVLRSAGTLFL
jgi:hypothetical protein